MSATVLWSLNSFLLSVTENTQKSADDRQKRVFASHHYSRD